MMNVFKRKSVHMAVLAGLGAVGAAGTANAVHVNPDGTGQVLIYPYYTVRSATSGAATGQYNTYISVTNTTSAYKAVKVRFLEGKNSREVLDFNLFLSPYDVWTASVEPTTNGAMILTSDKSCTNGVIPVAGQPFSNGQYAGAQTDNEDATLDRTREGYVELIEMGEYTTVAGAVYSALRVATLHSSAGVPPCTASALAAVDVAPGDALAGLAPATGGLMGGASLVNPATGVDYSYDAVAIDNWTTNAHGSASTATTPTIGSGSVVVSEMFVGSQLKTATWAGLSGATSSAEAVSASMMHNAVFNEFVLDTATTSKSDWVVTFPTKRLFVGVDAVVAGVRAHNPAFNPFNEDFGLGGSCDDIGLTVYSREEQTTVAQGGFSPAPAASVPQLCWEANVITFNRSAVSPLTSAVLGSTNVRNIDTTYQNGWVRMVFDQPLINVLTPLNSSTNGAADATLESTYGLPVVGFMVQDFVNGNLNGLQSTYGGDFGHKSLRCVEDPALHITPHVSTPGCRNL